MEILALCARLNAVGETRLVFTSREVLPEPFDKSHNRLELERLTREDAVKLVEAVLGQGSGGAGASSDAADEAIAELVDEVHGHARTLALLAPSLRGLGDFWGFTAGAALLLPWMICASTRIRSSGSALCSAASGCSGIMLRSR